MNYSKLKEMKLTILGAGTGTSQLPNIADLYPPGFLVEWADTSSPGGTNNILFECSEGIRFRLRDAGFNIADITHLAVSHPHPDHYALPQLYQAMGLNRLWGGRERERTELEVYGPAAIGQSFAQNWQNAFPDRAGQEFEQIKLNFHAMPEENGLAIGSGKLFAEKVYHAFGQCPAVAFRLETPEGVFVYSGDTGDCPGIRKICQNADIFVCEASARAGDNDTPINYGHLNPKIAGEIAKAGNVKKLILCHYTGLDTDQAMLTDCRLSGFAGEVIIGKDFQTFEIQNPAPAQYYNTT